MYIARGTTPTHIFTIPISKIDLYSLEITYLQANKLDPVVTKVWMASNTRDNTEDIVNDSSGSVVITDITSADPASSEVDVALSFTDTTSFDPKHFVKVQISFLEKATKSNYADGEDKYQYETYDGKKYYIPGDSHKSDPLYLSVLDDLSNPYVG